MTNDKLGLTWEQQVEYNRVHQWGRGLNLAGRAKRNRNKEEHTNNLVDAEVLLNDC